MSDFQHSGCRCSCHSSDRTDAVYRCLAESDAPLAMGYVPCQSWGVTYDLCHALHTGTIFPELHKPFCGKGGKCR